MSVRAVVVGSLVMDQAFRVPRRPAPGEVVVADAFGAYRGGKGYNQAVALARLGAQVTMIGAVGADAYGDGFLDALAREGIDAGRVVQLRGTSTAIAVPLITPDGDAAFVQYPGANRQLAPAHCADLPDCDVLLLQGEVNAVTSEHAGRIIRRRGGIVLLRPTPVAEVTRELLDVATVVVASETEARTLLNVEDGRDAIELAEALHTPERAAAVRVTPLEAAWASDDESGFVTGPPVTVTDATGAGDSFCAGLAVALAEGAGFEAAVRFATAASAHTCTVAGAEPSLPARWQVEALLNPAA